MKLGNPALRNVMIDNVMKKWLHEKMCKCDATFWNHTIHYVISTTLNIMGRSKDHKFKKQKVLLKSVKYIFKNHKTHHTHL